VLAVAPDGSIALSLPKVTLYSKPICPLCDEAKVVLEQARKQIPFHLEVVDIESDREYFEAYKWEIPVVHVDGRMAFKHRLDLPKVLTRLRRR
jgi:glutaredoxin